MIEYEGLYKINNIGQIKNNKDKILKCTKSNLKHQYPLITLSKNGKKKTFMIHRLVAIHFIENPGNKEQVNHIDKDKSNYHYKNLEWCSPKENMKHHYENGGEKFNNQIYKNKFGKSHNRSIKLLYDNKVYYGYSEMAREYNKPISTLYYYVKNSILFNNKKIIIYEGL